MAFSVRINPAAEIDPNSTIAGMPVLQGWKVQHNSPIMNNNRRDFMY